MGLLFIQLSEFLRSLGKCTTLEYRNNTDNRTYCINFPDLKGGVLKRWKPAPGRVITIRLYSLHIIYIFIQRGIKRNSLLNSSVIGQVFNNCTFISFRHFFQRLYLWRNISSIMGWIRFRLSTVRVRIKAKSRPILRARERIALLLAGWLTELNTFPSNCSSTRRVGQ